MSYSSIIPKGWICWRSTPIQGGCCRTFGRIAWMIPAAAEDRRYNILCQARILLNAKHFHNIPTLRLCICSTYPGNLCSFRSNESSHSEVLCNDNSNLMVSWDMFSAESSFTAVHTTTNTGLPTYYIGHIVQLSSNISRSLHSIWPLSPILPITLLGI